MKKSLKGKVVGLTKKYYYRVIKGLVKRSNRKDPFNKKRELFYSPVNFCGCKAQSLVNMFTKPVVHKNKTIFSEVCQSACRAANFTMVVAYWKIGKRIVKYEQSGNEKAAYEKGLLRYLFVQLTADFGKCFGESNLHNVRLFCRSF